MLDLRISSRLISLVLAAAPLFAQSVNPLTDFAKTIDSPDLSPDGKTLAFAWDKDDLTWGIFLRPFAGGEANFFAGEDDRHGSPISPRWSPGGAEIAFSRFYCESCNYRLFVKGYPRGGERELGEVCQSPVSWTPDGRFLIAAEPIQTNFECRIALIPADGSGRTTLVSPGDIAALSPDGKRLAYSDGNELKLAKLTADFRIADTPVTLAKEPHPISTVNWTRDGKAILSQFRCDWNYYAKLISAKRAALPSLVVDPGGNMEISKLLPDGSGLGAEYGGGESALWRIDLHAGIQNPEKVRNVAWTDQLLSVSPNGQWLAFATNRNGPTQIWVSHLDGTTARVLVSAIPPFDGYGDRTSIDGMSWSPDGRWIALLTDPGVGHGVDSARLFLAPASGGRLRVLVGLCSQIHRAPPWSADSRSVFIAKEDENYRPSFFQVDIASGKQTPVPETSLPAHPQSLAPMPSDAEQPHLAQGGRFLYYLRRDQSKTRIVILRNLLSGSARH